MWVRKKFESEKNLGLKKFCSKKNLESEKNFGKKKILVTEKFFVTKKKLGPKNFGSKNFFALGLEPFHKFGMDGYYDKFW